MKELLEKVAQLEKSLTANSVGLQNVYNEFSKYAFSDISNKIKDLNDRLDHYERDKNVTDFGLDIQRYPFNIRVRFLIITNFGEISQTIDYPPFLEYKLGSWISHVYTRLLENLYDDHEKRGGKYMGEDGCKDWLDKNGKTIVALPSQLSKRTTNLLE